MATLTETNKKELAYQLKGAVEEAQTGAGVTASLSEIETTVDALVTAVETDASTVTAQQLIDARAMIDGCQFGSVASSSTEWSTATDEAAEAV